MGTGLGPWSPDSQHFINLQDNGVRLYDRSGLLVGTYGVEWASWLDDSHIAGIAGAGSQKGTIWDMSTGNSEEVDVPGPLEYALANGHGAVAFAWPIDQDWPATHYNYAVWDGSALTAPREGFPAAWSPDGSTLAIFHAFAPNRDGGWVSAVSWPSLGVTYADAPPFAAGYVNFDPSGRYIAYDTDTTGRPDTFLTRVVDLQTGSLVDIDRGDPYGGFAFWTANEQLLLNGPGMDSSAIVRYAMDGTKLSTQQGPGSVSIGSQDGSASAFWDGGDETKPDIWLRSVRGDEQLIAPSDVVAVLLANDGSALTARTAGSIYLKLL